MTANNEKSSRNLGAIDPKIYSRIQALRLMDDDFMTVVFSSEPALTEFLLKILLSRDLRVKSVLTQQEKHNIFGRSVRLDILALDTDGKQYNVEIQRADKGASPKRARYNLAMLDSHTLKKNDDFSLLPETYIIFITENDFFGEGKPFYEITRTIKGSQTPFADGCTIIYVNGAYRGDDAIGHLMHDFCESDASKMYYDEIASRVQFHKQQTKETKTMSRIIEEYGDERAEETRKTIVCALLQQNKLTKEEISSVSQVPLEQVQQLASSLQRANAPL